MTNLVLQTGYPAEVANHVRAGYEQTHDGYSAPGTFDITANVSTGGWDTIGPTGSGADYEWAAMDDIPSTGRALKVTSIATLENSAASVASYYVAAAEGQGSAPIAAGTADRHRMIFTQIDVSATLEDWIDTHNLVIPLSADQTFWMYYLTNNMTFPIQLDWHYRGFITN